LSAQVDHDLLADYVGGALDGTPDADRVAQLIASSPQWRTASDELTSALRAVSDDLEALRGTPEIMPPEIVARFNELLGSPAMTPQAAKPATDPLAARQPTRPTKSPLRMRRLAVPVAMLAVIFGFMIVANFFSQNTDLSEKPAGAPPRDNSTAELSDGQSLPVPTMTSGTHHNRSSLGMPMTAASPPTATTAKSQATETPNGFDVTGGIPPELMRLTESAALTKCLEAVALVLPGTVDLIDYAYFENQPALVMSITSTDGKWTFVAGPGCGIKGADEKFRAPLQ